MALVLVATVGASNANTYVSLADADTFFESVVGATAWTTASDDDQKKALVHATRDLDSYAWTGFKNTSTQALEFPRDNQVEATTALPAWLIQATCFQAMHVLANSLSGGVDERGQLRAAGVTSYSIGGLSETFGGGAAGQAALLAPKAQRLVSGYLRRGGVIAGPRDTAAPGRPWWPFTEA